MRISDWSSDVCSSDLLTAGFWLSFAGVAWLAWCLPDAGKRIVGDFLSAQGVATLGLLPLTVVLFGQASLAGPLANLVAIPWWSLVVVPLSLLGTALEALHHGAGEWAWRAAAWCFALSWPAMQWLAGSRFAPWWLPGADRKGGVWGKGGSARVDIGGRGIIKKKKNTQCK